VLAAGVPVSAFCASAEVGIETGSIVDTIRAIAADFDTARDVRRVLQRVLGPPVFINVLPKTLYLGPDDQLRSVWLMEDIGPWFRHGLAAG
jgi:hypothetical protein